MIIVDRALRERDRRGEPIRVAMVGAGAMGRGIANQVIRHTPGMDLVAISNRSTDRAVDLFESAGADGVGLVDSVEALEGLISDGIPAVTSDPMILCAAEGIDAIIEVTGAVEFSAGVARAAIENRKHLILMNAELDATVGPLLKAKADEAGVVVTNADGDQPGVIMNLYRFVKGIGVNPVLCGNIKGLHDRYRNPTTQAEFAKRWKQNPYMVTSFADGTKISFEQALVANATGMRVARRGMHGLDMEPGTPIQETVDLFPMEDLVEGPGIVDYVIGAMPSPGVFVLGTSDDPLNAHYLDLFKMGQGPLYCFYRPYHLCYFEVPATVARAVIFGDATIAPLDGPMVDVVAAAKVDLHPGDELDAIGGYKTYGLAENSDVTASERLLPIGVAEGCKVVRPISRDEVVTYDAVEAPEGRLIDRLRAEQDSMFKISV